LLGVDVSFTKLPTLTLFPRECIIDCDHWSRGTEDYSSSKPAMIALTRSNHERLALLFHQVSEEARTQLMVQLCNEAVGIDFHIILEESKSTCVSYVRLLVLVLGAGMVRAAFASATSS
jgi:hypothetical protein